MKFQDFIELRLKNVDKNKGNVFSHRTAIKHLKRGLPVAALSTLLPKISLKSSMKISFNDPTF